MQIGRALSGKDGAWPTRVGGPPAPSKGHLLVLLTEGMTFLHVAKPVSSALVRAACPYQTGLPNSDFQHVTV